jgi:hypothetical protein
MMQDAGLRMQQGILQSTTPYGARTVLLVEWYYSVEGIFHLSRGYLYRDYHCSQHQTNNTENCRV